MLYRIIAASHNFCPDNIDTVNDFLEEAGLIKKKEQYSKVVRMMEGTEWGKIVQSGNCIESSIFEDAFN
ncbi:MAG: hypothetical protein IH955_10545, partial [Chloroflexi bacterium]|nr:hypothetical protein [Chloroflexota bacterium]